MCPKKWDIVINVNSQQNCIKQIWQPIWAKFDCLTLLQQNSVKFGKDFTQAMNFFRQTLFGLLCIFPSLDNTTQQFFYNRILTKPLKSSTEIQFIQKLGFFTFHIETRNMIRSNP